VKVTALDTGASDVAEAVGSDSGGSEQENQDKLANSANHGYSNFWSCNFVPMARAVVNTL